MTAGGDRLAELIDSLKRDSGLVVRRQEYWVVVIPAEAEPQGHGWKLHLSTRPGRLAEVASKVVPFLREAGCAFKFAESEARLAELNSGAEAPAAVGKAFTIYPAPDRVRSLGLALVELLRDEQGPRVLSDRRIDDNAPVYYRYGPFSPPVDARGLPVNTVHGPHGEVFEAEATLEYRQPSWVSDPFTDASKPAVHGRRVGGHFRVIDGVFRSARGNVYRAVDERTGKQVIVKQARAFVAESRDGADTRLRIRNERRILEAAAGIAGVPGFVDHFQHADDEFLVSTDQGEIDLGEDIRQNGAYRTGSARRSLEELARALATVMAELHERGILIRDLKPKNIVIDQGVRPTYSLVDFGSAVYGGVDLHGYTLRYASPRQVRGEPPQVGDDYFALGMTLVEAMTGLPPVVLDDTDLEQPQRRGLAAVYETFGAEPTGIGGVIADLIGGDEAAAAEAFDRLLNGHPGVHRASVDVPRTPEISPELVADLTQAVLDGLLEEVDQLLNSDGAGAGAEPGITRKDPSIFTGLSGIGLELVHHGDRPGVADRIERLADAVCVLLSAREVPPGLIIGRTGADYFLRLAGRTFRRPIPDVEREVDGLDLFTGAVGVGLAHLWFDEPEALAVVRRCAERVAGSELEGTALAHGLAGTLQFQLVLAEHDLADPGEVERIARRVDDRVRSLIDAAADRRGDPLHTVSWCNGLAGSARVLLHAGRTLRRQEFTKTAIEGGDLCAAWAPRLEVLGQCCGAAGVGDLLIDLANATGETRYSEGARDVLRHILLRSDFAGERPMFLQGTPHDGAAAWGIGTAGVLGFLRRLRDGGGPRILPFL